MVNLDAGPFRRRKERTCWVDLNEVYGPPVLGRVENALTELERGGQNLGAQREKRSVVNGGVDVKKRVGQKTLNP